MSCMNYVLLELENDSVFLNLGSFYNRYSGSFFYYQQKKVFMDDNDDEGYSEYIFNLNKSDCRETNKDGKLISVLMVHISSKGLALPEEILREVRLNNNKIYFYSNGYGDFTLSVKEPQLGLTSDDEEYLISLFNTFNDI